MRTDKERIDELRAGYELARKHRAENAPLPESALFACPAGYGRGDTSLLTASYTSTSYVKPLEEVPEAVLDAVAAELGTAMDCTRVWSAWGVGTMSQDDFSVIAEDSDRVAEISLAAINAYIGATQS